MKSTHNVCLVALLRAVLLLDDVGELVVVPVVHVVIFVAFVLVEVPLRRLPLDRRVVRELALVALLAQPLLEEGAEHRLGVHSWRGNKTIQRGYSARAQILGTGPSLFLDGPEPRVSARAE